MIQQMLQHLVQQVLHRFEKGTSRSLQCGQGMVERVQQMEEIIIDYRGTQSP
jgi:hypothetical protein